MNCHKCGNLVQPGTPFCPFCNEPLNTGYPQQNYQQGYGGYMQQGMPQQPAGYDQFSINQPQQTDGYQQAGGYGYMQEQPPSQQQSFPQQQNYPPGYQTPYIYGQQAASSENKFLTSISELPRMFLESFTKPSEVLRGMIERRDMITGPIVVVLTLILSFLAGMLIMRGFVGVLFRVASAITNTSMAGNAASMNQGINYIARQFGPAVGGIVTLCQIISILIPAIVSMVYICLICKVRFSWELLLGFSGVITMPTVLVTLLAMLASLLSPWVSLLICILGMVISYCQMGMMMTHVTGKTDMQVLPAKMICICLSILLMLLLNALVGGTLMLNTITRILTYI